MISFDITTNWNKKDFSFTFFPLESKKLININSVSLQSFFYLGIFQPRKTNNVLK